MNQKNTHCKTVVIASEIEKNRDTNDKQDYRLNNLEEELRRVREEVEKNRDVMMKGNKELGEWLKELEDELKDLKKRVEVLEGDRRRLDQLEQKIIGMAKKLSDLN